MGIILILGGIIYMGALYYKPEWIAILLFSITIAGVNIDVAGSLNLRALVTISLFLRILIDKSILQVLARFISYNSGILIASFMGFILLVSAFQDLYNMDLLKLISLTSIVAFCAYYFYVNDNSDRLLRISLLISGIVCFIDLAYTYIFVGTMPVNRVYEVFAFGQGAVNSSGEEILGSSNHNFFGQICGMTLIYFVCDYINDKKPSLLKLVLLPLMFLGVLMSTSRSALAGSIMVIILIGLNSMNFREKKRNLSKIIGFSIGSIFIGLFAFTIFGQFLNLEGRFVEEIIYRLVDEPMAMIQKALGLNYNIQNLDSGDWRVKASANAFESFLNLPFIEQFFGIGYGGFIARNLGQGLNAHNGVLLILIELGILGFILYLLIVLGLIWKSFRIGNISPVLMVLIFVVIYAIGQNYELTQATTFLFVFTLLGEIQSYSNKKYQVTQMGSVSI